MNLWRTGPKYHESGAGNEEKTRGARAWRAPASRLKRTQEIQQVLHLRSVQRFKVTNHRIGF